MSSTIQKTTEGNLHFDTFGNLLRTFHGLSLSKVKQNLIGKDTHINSEL